MYTTFNSYNNNKSDETPVKKEIQTIEELNEIIEQPLAVVKVYATWCGPCQRLATPFQNLMAEFSNVPYANVNVDSRLIEGVTGLPTILFYRNGQIVHKVMGADLQSIRQALVELIS